MKGALIWRFAGLALLSPSAALAQEQEQTQGQVQTDSFDVRLDNVATDQSSAPTFLPSLSFREAVEIRGGTEKEEASIQIGHEVGLYRWNTTFTTPVDKETKEGVFGTLDGLSDAIRLKSEFSRLMFDPTTRIANIPARNTACIAAGAMRGYSADQVRTGFINGNEGGCDDLTAPSTARDGDFFIGTFSDEERESVARQLRPIRNDYLLESVGGRWIPQVRAGLTVGTEDFKYLASASLQEEKDDKTEWAFTFGFTWVDVVRPRSIGFEYRREETYKDNEKGTICTPHSTIPNVLDCDTSAIGTPVNEDKDLFAVTFNLLRDRWAMGSIVTRDFDADEYGVEVPFYFIRNAEQNWTGGVSLGWTTIEQDLTAQVFIGVPFSILD